jgi:hypothetical protein
MAPSHNSSFIWIPVEQLGTSEWYIVTNPLKRYVVTPRGDVRKQISSRAASIAGILTIIAGPLAGILTMTSSPDLDWTPRQIVFYAVGYTGFVGLSAWLTLRLVAAYQTGRDRADAYLRVDPHNALAWRLCRVTESVIRTAAWRDGTVDPNRQVAIISWSAIGRSLMAAQRLDDARRAIAHSSLAGLAKEALAKLEEEMDALEQIYLNLGRVLLAAKSVDEQRILSEQRRKDRIAQRREEAELRQKLTGSTQALDAYVSFEDADRSAGVAAETNAIAQLLADSEELLRDVH